MKALVFGLGISGRSSLRYLQNKGVKVLVSDDNLKLQKEFQDLFYLKEEIPFSEIDLVVISPGVPPSHFIVLEAEKRGITITSEIELALLEIQKRNIRAFGITGTNGKTTTTALTAHILSQCGIQAKAVGNIGIPVLDVLEENPEVLILELSSFQLESAKVKALEACAITNITPDHLDRYSSFEEYRSFKWKIQELLKEDGTIILSKELLENAPLITRKKVQFDTEEYENDLMRVFRKMPVTDRQNTLVALSIVRAFGLSSVEVYEAIKTFKKDPHRMEYVRTVDGVSYYNDSKATNVGAVIPAVLSFERPIYLIAGGVHKGHPYTEWREHFSSRVSVVFAIGEAKEIIKKDLLGIVSVVFCDTLQDAILQAKQKASGQGTILLSPGCSSYDMFCNYEERGNIFKQVVYSIA